MPATAADKALFNILADQRLMLACQESRTEDASENRRRR